MSDNIATLEGFTVGYIAECGLMNVHILVKPETDLDSRFKAWDCDNQQWLNIFGYVWTFEPTNDK